MVQKIYFQFNDFSFLVILKKFKRNIQCSSSVDQNMGEETAFNVSAVLGWALKGNINFMFHSKAQL